MITEKEARERIARWKGAYREDVFERPNGFKFMKVTLMHTPSPSSIPKGRYHLGIKPFIPDSSIYQHHTETIEIDSFIYEPSGLNDKTVSCKRTKCTPIPKKNVRKRK